MTTAPRIALLAFGGLLIVGILGQRSSTASHVFQMALLALLAGYMLFGRGFGYVGIPPVYVGEVALAVGVLTLPFRSASELKLSIWSGILLFAVSAFIAWGMLTTLPYIGQYGLNSLRDAVVWAYAAFALLVYLLLNSPTNINFAARCFKRAVPIYLPSALAISLLISVAPEAIPQLPNTDVPIVGLKPGDTAVHLAGIAAFLLLGLHRLRLGKREVTRTFKGDWLIWALWCAATLVIATRGRGGVLAIITALGAIALLKPTARLVKPLTFALLIILMAIALDVAVAARSQRQVSANQLLTNLVSIKRYTGDSQLDNSRDWRIRWWRRIVDYTVNGPYFWQGKGYGINLADEDGFQVTADHSLRSPHSINLTILARSGVPGLVLWITMQAAFLLGLLAARRRARQASNEVLERLSLWILAYWLAMLVNAGFDVYLEGPQGGIWFWTTFGFGMVIMSLAHALPAETVEPSTDSSRTARDVPLTAKPSLEV